MKFSKLKQAYKLFRHTNASKKTVRFNVLAYLKSLEVLGSKWVLANPVQWKGV